MTYTAMTIDAVSDLATDGQPFTARAVYARMDFLFGWDPDCMPSFSVVSSYLSRFCAEKRLLRVNPLSHGASLYIVSRTKWPPPHKRS